MPAKIPLAFGTSPYHTWYDIVPQEPRVARETATMNKARQTEGGIARRDIFKLVGAASAAGLAGSGPVMAQSQPSAGGPGPAASEGSRTVTLERLPRGVLL